MKLKNITKTKPKTGKETKTSNVIIVNDFALDLNLNSKSPSSIEGNVSCIPTIIKNILNTASIKEIKIDASDILIKYEKDGKFIMRIKSTNIGGVSGKVITIKEKKNVILLSSFIKNKKYITLSNER